MLLKISSPLVDVWFIVTAPSLLVTVSRTTEPIPLFVIVISPAPELNIFVPAVCKIPPLEITETAPVEEMLSFNATLPPEPSFFTVRVPFLLFTCANEI